MKGATPSYASLSVEASFAEHSAETMAVIVKRGQGGVADHPGCACRCIRAEDWKTQHWMRENGMRCLAAAVGHLQASFHVLENNKYIHLAWNWHRLPMPVASKVMHSDSILSRPMPLAYSTVP